MYAALLEVAAADPLEAAAPDEADLALVASDPDADPEVEPETAAPPVAAEEPPEEATEVAEEAPPVTASEAMPLPTEV